MSAEALVHSAVPFEHNRNANQCIHLLSFSGSSPALKSPPFSAFWAILYFCRVRSTHPAKLLHENFIEFLGFSRLYLDRLWIFGINGWITWKTMLLRRCGNNTNQARNDKTDSPVRSGAQQVIVGHWCVSCSVFLADCYESFMLSYQHLILLESQMSYQPMRSLN